MQNLPVIHTSCYEATMEEEYHPSLHNCEHPKYIKIDWYSYYQMNYWPDPT